jgi:hypothetical protein
VTAPGPNVPFPPMEAELVEELPHEGAWQFEPKWDGFAHMGTRGSPVGPLLYEMQRPARSRAALEQSPAPPARHPSELER